METGCGMPGRWTSSSHTIEQMRLAAARIAAHTGGGTVWWSTEAHELRWQFAAHLTTANRHNSGKHAIRCTDSKRRRQGGQLLIFSRTQWSFIHSSARCAAPCMWSPLVSTGGYPRRLPPQHHHWATPYPAWLSKSSCTRCRAPSLERARQCRSRGTT